MMEAFGDKRKHVISLYVKNIYNGFTRIINASRIYIENVYSKSNRIFYIQCPNGVATTKDLTPAYAKLFPLGDSRKYAEMVFNSFDEDRDGIVSFGDLLTGLASIVKGNTDQKLVWIFRFVPGIVL